MMYCKICDNELLFNGIMYQSIESIRVCYYKFKCTGCDRTVRIPKAKAIAAINVVNVPQNILDKVVLNVS